MYEVFTKGNSEDHKQLYSKGTNSMAGATCKSQVVAGTWDCRVRSLMQFQDEVEGRREGKGKSTGKWKGNARAIETVAEI